MERFVNDSVNLYLSPRDVREIMRLYLTGNVDEKREIERFEREFAGYLGARYAVCLSSARLGLYIILKYISSLLKDEGRREIILSAYNFFAMPHIIRSCGFFPRYADAECESGNLDFSQIGKNISGRTAGILATHTYGNPCCLSAITGLAAKHGLFLIEDCAHALGGEFEAKKVGTFGLGSIFSLSLSKMITTFFGGMLATNDAGLYEFAKREVTSYRRVGKTLLLKKAAFGAVAGIFSSPRVFNALTFYLWWILSRYFSGIRNRIVVEKSGEVPVEEIKKRMSAFQALIGTLQLDKLDGILEKRIRNSRILAGRLNGIGGISLLRNTFQNSHKSVFLNFAARVKNREKVLNELLRLGVDSRKGYLVNCASAEGKNGRFAAAQNLESEVLFLPNHNRFSEPEMEHLAEKLASFFSEHEGS